MEKNCSRFKEKLVKIKKDVNGRFDDYFISPNIRQILLHWGLSYLYFMICFLNMSYYWFNRQVLLEKAQNKCHNCAVKEKVAEYFIKNKDL